MTRGWFRFLTSWAASVLLGGTLVAQGTALRAFDPFPAGSAAGYHFDLTRNFFRTPDEEAAERRLLATRLQQLQQLAYRLPQTADAMLTALRLQDSLQLQVNRHASYLELRYYADTRDTVAQRAAGQLQSVAGRSFAVFDSALVSRPDSFLAHMEHSDPALRRYRFALENAKETAAHRLTADGERALTALGSMANGGGAQLFSATLRATDFGFVETSVGSLSVARDYSAIATNPDRRVRREGFLRNRDGLARQRQVYADILVRTAIALNAAARLRGYEDYAAESYGGRFLNRAKVLAFLNALAARADVNKRIEHALIDHYRKTFGLDTVHVWDLALPEPGADVPRFTIGDATKLVVDGTRSLGDGYTRELTQLLDPVNGRLDVAPAPNRATRQGFSTGLVGFPSMFFQGAFGGYLEDVVTLAHESGHAVQNMLMTSNGVLPRYAAGPAFFTESFAGLSELLVLERLYLKAPDRAHRIIYLQRLITQGAEVFRTGWESLVEQQLFDSARAGKQLSTDELEALTQATGSRFSVWFGPGSERQLAWVQPTQFFTRPLYRVNYVYSKLLALRYIDLLHRTPGDFRRRYASLLGNGYDAPPDTLLRRFMDTSLEDPALLDGAVHVLEAWLQELESLYRS